LRRIDVDTSEALGRGMRRGMDVNGPDESKYVQQHLANERTFLAWIRTIISILGVGFVTTSLHFELMRDPHPLADLLVRSIGIATMVLALVSSVYACWSYLKKRDGINANAFRSPSRFPVFLSASIIVLLLVIVVYLLAAY
jgi:putative membrane protein